MEFKKSELKNGHYYVGQVNRGKLYRITFKHDNIARFIVEILDSTSGKILHRPNAFETTGLPNVPYTLEFMAFASGELAIHYSEKQLATSQWEKIYDLTFEEVR